MDRTGKLGGPILDHSRAASGSVGTTVGKRPPHRIDCELGFLTFHVVADNLGSQPQLQRARGVRDLLWAAHTKEILPGERKQYGEA